MEGTIVYVECQRLIIVVCCLLLLHVHVSLAVLYVIPSTSSMMVRGPSVHRQTSILITLI
jgi:hypothetical protein